MTARTDPFSEVAAACWADAALAAGLLAVDPTGLGGVWLRAHPGPALDRWTALLRELMADGAPVRRMPAHAADDRLLGGLDLAATLRTGRPVTERGLLAETDGGVLVVPMAERLNGSVAARLAVAIDTGTAAVERDGVSARHAARIGVVAIDEGRDDDDAVPAALLDRLALAIDLRPVDWRTVDRGVPGTLTKPVIEAARRRLRRVTVDEAAVASLCGCALALGIESLRIALLAGRAAAAHAALHGREEAAEADLQAAARLVLAARATRVPADEAPQEEPAPEDNDASQPEDSSEDPAEPGTDTPSADQLLEAIQAALPPDLLERLAAGRAARQSAPAGGRRGEEGVSRRRGRPVGVGRGDPRRGDRLNVVETLRAAAPWQRLRGRDGGTILVRPDDFRTTRFRRNSESVTVFVVDASGSAALYRLAEAKGAVEMLLAECYVRRDQVALVAFRRDGAELLLPPTRSLVRAKRSLAGLPGGGGTPLYAGLEMAAALAEGIRRQGRTPGLVVLTDGRANVARGGVGGREAAVRDALDAARRIARAGIAGIVIDTAPRPRPEAADLAQAMRGIYLPMPHADAATLSRAVQVARGDPVGRRPAA